MIDGKQTLGKLATAHPAAPAIFLRHRLDFCCRGGQTLDEACRTAGLDVATVVAEIAEQGDRGAVGPARWDMRPLPELVEHIVTRYHEPLRIDLPPLIEAARKVERVHGQKTRCPHGLADHLATLHGEILNHLEKEEQILFPAIRSGSRGPSVLAPVQVMMQEHEDHGANLQRVRELTSDLEVPPEACGTWRALYGALGDLEAELMEHIHLENNVLFPRALDE